jgi:glycerol kinase
VSNKYVLSIDQGTTGSTVLVLDQKAKVVGRAYSEFKQYYPKPGWVEHDAEEIWTVTAKCIRGALKAAKIRAKDLATIGITNQRETVVVWDAKTGKPIHRAIVWQCRRTAEICAGLKKKRKEAPIRKRTGLVLDPYFSGTKLSWILSQVKGARKQAEAGKLLAGTIDTWLIWKLTGGKVHATDPTNASRTMLYNIHQRKWDSWLCKTLDVPRAVLPKVCPSSGKFGVATEGFGVKAAVPIHGVAGDQQAALYGQGCWDPGMAKNTYGTGCFMLLNTGKKAVTSKSGLLTTIACGPRGEACYALEGSVFVAGAAIQWLRDELKFLSDAKLSEKMAGRVKDTGGVYLVPAFVGLGAPYWDAEARGALVGLTRGTNRNHVVRAALEAMAYQTKDLADAMQKDSGVKMKELRVDGGACANNLLMDFQASILGIEVDRPRMIETTALGAAFLAGLGAGVWKSPAQLAKVRRTQRRFQPKLKKKVAVALYKGWLRAVARVR